MKLYVLIYDQKIPFSTCHGVATHPENEGQMSKQSNDFLETPWNFHTRRENSKKEKEKFYDHKSKCEIGRWHGSNLVRRIFSTEACI